MRPSDMTEAEYKQAKAYGSLLYFICDHDLAMALPFDGFDLYGRIVGQDAILTPAQPGRTSEFYAISRGHFEWNGSAFNFEFSAHPLLDELSSLTYEKFAFQFEARREDKQLSCTRVRWGWEERVKDVTPKVRGDIEATLNALGQLPLPNALV